MLRIVRNTGFSKYYFSIDLQVAWLNIWIQMIRKKK